MRSFSAVSPLLFLLLSAAVAQTPKTVRWAEGEANSSSEVKNDIKVEGLKTEDLHIFVSLAEVKETEFNRVWVQLINHGSGPVSFDPQSAILLRGDKSVRPEVPDKAAGLVQKLGEAKSQEVSASHCNLMMTGRSTGGGCQANDSEVEMGKQIATIASQQAQWIRENGMKTATLAPEEQAQGAILFRKEKKAAEYILRITAGSEVFEFPLGAQNKHPSYE
jgi:hypothetical protein